MASSKYKLEIAINDSKVNELNIPLDYFKEELHSILISYGDCVNRYALYEFENGYNVFYVISILVKIYPAFQSMLNKFQLTNKLDERINLLNFLT